MLCVVHQMEMTARDVGGWSTQGGLTYVDLSKPGHEVGAYQLVERTLDQGPRVLASHATP